MSQNKHATEAQDLMSANQASSLGFETADAQHIITHLQANTQAILALAYEQRTANMLAYFSNVQVTGDLAHAIDARLGL